MVRDANVAVVVEGGTGEEVDFVDPIHDGKGDEGDEEAEGCRVSEEYCNEDLINEVTVPLPDIVLRVFKFFV